MTGLEDRIIGVVVVFGIGAIMSLFCHYIDHSTNKYIIKV